MTTPDDLRAIPLFADLPDEVLERIAGKVTSATVAAHHMLIDVGQAASGVFILQEGDAVAELPDGRTVDIPTGSCFGELALLTDRGRTARVRTRSESKVLALARDDFQDLIASEPVIAVALLRNLAERLVDQS
jgi:CRP-like cAMP-binding protein